MLMYHFFTKYVITKPCDPLVITSTILLFPIIYKKSPKHLYIMSSVNSLVSILYWLDPHNIPKMVVDIIVANITGIAYFTHGIIHIPGSNHTIRTIGYINTAAMLSFFCKSCIEYRGQNSEWIYYHIGFHITTIFSKVFVLHNT